MSQCVPISVITQDGYTALILAIKYDRFKVHEVVSLLLESGANTNLVTEVCIYVHW